MLGTCQTAIALSNMDTQTNRSRMTNTLFDMALDLLLRIFIGKTTYANEIFFGYNGEGP